MMLDIFKAVISKLRLSFEYAIYDNEVKEGFERPSFFVQVLPITANFESAGLRYFNYMVVITYFASTSATTIELMNVIDKLDFLFGPSLAIADRTLTPQNIEAEIEEKALQYRFDLMFYDSVEQTTESAEPMTDLQIVWRRR